MSPVQGGILITVNGQFLLGDTIISQSETFCSFGGILVSTINITDAFITCNSPAYNGSSSGGIVDFDVIFQGNSWDSLANLTFTYFDCTPISPCTSCIQSPGKK